jgi:hypothetical protein
MARTAAGLPAGVRLCDFISLGVVARAFPSDVVRSVLEEAGVVGKRTRELPSQVVVYYAIALGLYMQVSYGEVLRCLLEGVRWLFGPGVRVKVTGKSGISQARSRVGSKPLELLCDRATGPVATDGTKGSWYGTFRVVSLDSSTLDVADTKENEEAFGRPGASMGRSAFPKIRFCALVECGTHVLFGIRMGPYRTSEVTLAKGVASSLRSGMLCLADRGFFSFELWSLASSTGAELVWRVTVGEGGRSFPVVHRLADGSYLSVLHQAPPSRRNQAGGVTVRVVDYELEGEKERYRLVTTLLDPERAPAEELACLYHERWEIETSLDELKTHLRGARVVLRSKKPDLVRQEFYGLMLAHYAVRKLMHEAALQGDRDPDTVSFTHTLRVIRRKLPRYVALSPSGEETAP